MRADDPARAFLGFVNGSLLPRWADRAVHPDGGFHERLDPALKPIPLGYRRLLSQCRLLFSFAESASADAESLVIPGFRWVVEHYYEGDRGWRFALGDGGPLPAETRHLYAHAFALLACWARLRVADDAETRRIARETLAFINSAFRDEAPGFVSAIDANLHDLKLPRQQNPHMHLFESCVLLYDQTGDEIYASAAREIAGLLLDLFLDRQTGSLIEHFRPDGSADPVRGRLREPGHHFEWVWLIHRWLRSADDPRADELRDAADRLFAWAMRYGVDASGIVDEADVAGAVVQPTRRIWPVCEALKAIRFQAVARGESADGMSLERSLWRLLHDHYLRPDEAGWVEVLGPDLRPLTDYLPATTPYHLVMAARELAWLDRA